MKQRIMTIDKDNFNLILGKWGVSYFFIDGGKHCNQSIYSISRVSYSTESSISAGLVLQYLQAPGLSLRTHVRVCRNGGMLYTPHTGIHARIPPRRFAAPIVTT